MHRMTIPAPPRNDRRARRSPPGSRGRHEGFPDLLEDALRPLTDPLAIRTESARLLGRHLLASRVHYADVTPDASEAVIRGEYCDGVGSIAGRHPLNAYGPSVVEAFAAGRTVAVEDAVWDPGLTRAERLGALSIGARAYVVSPVLRDEGLTALLAVHHAGPRAWTPSEVALVQTTAERTWAVVERARSRVELEESENRFRAILDSVDQGYALVQVAFDARDRPLDYRILEVNRSFARHTGVENAAGHWARELVPGLDEGCFEILGRVALTGKPSRFEKRVIALGRWLEVDAFPVEPAHARRVGMVIRDITERREREANRAFLDATALALAAGGGPLELLQRAGQGIAGHLGVTQVGFYSVDGEQVRMLHEHRSAPSTDGGPALEEEPPGDGRAPRPVGVLVGEAVLRALEDGRPVPVPDTRTGARSPPAPADARPPGALLHIPHKSDGRLAFVLTVGQPRPRRWQSSEVELLQELTQRLWSGLERARADEALRRRERELSELSRTLEVRIGERTAELEEQTFRLRRLAAELASAEQRERKRLGGILHDHLQQLLYAARMQLDRVRSRVHGDERALAAAEDAQRQLADAIEAARDLTRQLRPPALYESGLGAALGWLSTEMDRLHGLEVKVEEEGPVPSLGDDLKALVFECVRELLFNVVKHAAADRASIRIAPGGGRLRLVVADGGKGFDVAAQGPRGSGDGSGLFSVSERLAALGGEVRIESSPGDGTRVEMTVPVD
jgi:PAS domain S-box-containing protein